MAETRWRLKKLFKHTPGERTAAAVRNDYDSKISEKSLCAKALGPEEANSKGAAK